MCKSANALNSPAEWNEHAAHNAWLRLTTEEDDDIEFFVTVKVGSQFVLQVTGSLFAAIGRSRREHCSPGQIVQAT